VSPLLPRWLRRPPPLDLIFRDSYSVELTGVDPLRGERILGALDEAGLVDRRHAHRAPVATFRDLRRVHTDPYLESLDRPGSLLALTGLQLPERSRERVLKAQRAMAGGTMQAARLAGKGRRMAANLGGGLHHAFADRGERFCAYNDVAVAIAGLRAEGFGGPILVIDLDLHDGDGTRSIFARDPSVHTFSIHNRSSPDDPAAPPVESTSVELPEGTGDAAFQAALEEHLPPVLRRFAPAFVFYVAGSDPAADDAIGDWKLTAQGLLERDLYVVSRVQERPGLPLVITLAGGYGLAAWRYSARFLGTLLGRGRPFEPPATTDSTLAHYRRLARDLVPGELTGDGDRQGDDDWNLTPEDLEGLFGAGPPHRLLSFYSHDGLELTLERTGLLERLRFQGFDPQIELDLDNSAGETVRVFGDLRRTQLLLEIRLRVDRGTLPGSALLRVEWLLLQNPRQGFSLSRPPLPGQKHPGLGMLQDVLALLVLAAERLHLDGVVFVPSHYHIATQGRLLHYLEPEREGKQRALRQALAGLSLAQATQAVDAGQVIDGATGQPLRWEPAEMILPISAELKARFAGDDYETRAAAEETRHAYRLADRTP
jgi:acetoin utilization deacetylase AcuC-like enzyme